MGYTLLIGQDPYGEDSKSGEYAYGPLHYSDINTKPEFVNPLDVVAFIPNTIVDISTFRRILGVIEGKEFVASYISENVGNTDEPIRLAEELLGRNIFLGNISEEENVLALIKSIKDYKHDANITVVLFGSQAIGKAHLFSNQEIEVKCMPHPSPQNNHPCWARFDPRFKPKDYDCNSVEEHFVTIKSNGNAR